jgi:CHRD domain
LTGAQEAPDPGDPNGSGQATITMRPPKGFLCFEIQVQRIQLPAIGAHIHQAPPGEPGPVVVPLGAPDETGTARGCMSGLSNQLLRHIALRPHEFYVNVHTRKFPAGAVRGQLTESSGG